jgi:predicted transposase/invertase (TIGR01784 family)
MPGKYVNPFTDFGFKKIFGEEANKDLLLSFLNELIKEQGKIEDIEYLNPEQLGMNEFERRGIYDIYCKSKNGSRFIVEMQKAEQQFFKDRSVYYSTFPIQKQALKGVDWNFKLDAVYFIGVLDFVFDEDLNDDRYRYHHVVKLMDVNRKKVFYDKLTYVYLEMPKFNKGESELNTLFDKWMYVLKHLPDLESRPPALQERVFSRLFKIAEVAKFDEKEQDAYHHSLKVYWDLNNIINFAALEGRNEGFAEGREKGRVEGKTEGRAEGMAEGEARGKARGKAEKTIEIVKNSFAAGIKIEQITIITGLSATEIVRILNDKGSDYNSDSGHASTLSEPRAKYTASRKVGKVTAKATGVRKVASRRDGK